MSKETALPDVSFDLPPEEFRRLGHQLIELMVETLEAERSDPVLRQVTGPEIRGMIDEPLPRQGHSPDDIMLQWRDVLSRYSRRHGHPRFFGYVCTSADPLGMLADAMASTVNQLVTAWRSSPSAIEIERLVLRWLDELVGFGANGNGLLVSGGSTANFHGLACAVTQAELLANLPSGSRHRLTVYMSREGHVSMKKAVQLLGIPSEHLRLLDIDDQRRLQTDALRAQLEEDRATGLIPAAVCASSGTANTGTIDPLTDVAEICAEHGVWFHIDGSYGAPAVMTKDYAWMAEAFGRADSLSLDPHKWLFAPADAGCVLIRDEEISRRTFTVFSEYTTVTQTDPIERFAFFDHGLEMSRRFRGLKVWTILKARGADRIAEVIQYDIDLRRHLDVRIDAEQRLESLGSELSIACFRYVPERASSDERLNAINQNIVEALVAEGRCYMSPTTLEGRYALRVCIVNFRTRREDIDFVVDEVLRLGREAETRGLREDI